MYKKTALAVAVSAVLILSACGTAVAPTKKEETPPQKVAAPFEKDDYLKLSGPTNELGAYLTKLAAPDGDGNVFVSPVSLFMALSMLQNGAEGKTRDGIMEAIQATGMDADTLNRANASLLDRLHNSFEDVTLKTANSLWVSDRYTIQEDFEKLSHDYYLANAEEIDVHDSKSADRINDWVKESTNGKIDGIVEAPLDESLVMYLMNAVYFKAPWTYPFSKELTEDGSFELEDGSEITVPFMSLSEELPYFENDQFQAVALPYGEGPMVMDIYVPKDGYDVETFLREWTPDNRSKWNDAFESRNGTVQLPKFQLEYEVILNDLLSESGMQQAFGDQAELGGLVKEAQDLYVSEVKQKTYLSVDEEGTEAAGVTSVMTKETSAPAGEPFQLEVDKPFFLTIRDEEADVLLFAGKIANPGRHE